MAFIEDDLLQPKKKKEDPDFVTQQPTTLAAPGQPTGTVADAPAGFATVQKYVEQNVPQAAALATKLAGGVTQKTEQARTDIGAAATGLQERVATGTPTYSPELIEKAVTTPGELTEEDKTAFAKQREALYKGPTDVTRTPEYQKALESLGTAREAHTLTESEAGQKQLLTELQKTKASGITDLNQALLSMTPGARAEFVKAQEGFTGLESFIKGISEAEPEGVSLATELQTSVAPGIQAGQEAARQAVGTTTSRVQAALDTQMADIDERLRGAQISREEYNVQLSNLRPALERAIQTKEQTVGDPQAVLSAVRESMWIHPNQRDQLQQAVSQYFTPSTTSQSSFDPWKTLNLIEAYPQMANVISPEEIQNAQIWGQLLEKAVNVPTAAGDQIVIPDIPEGLEPLVETYLADQKRSQNMRDIQTLFDDTGGPTDPLRKAATGTSLQDVAAQMMDYINRFGAGHYPNLSGEKVNAISRIANGSLDPELY